MKRIIATAVVLAAFVIAAPSAVASGTSDSTTAPPVSASPSTTTPVTEVPATSTPVTEVPATTTPVTEVPVTTTVTEVPVTTTATEVPTTTTLPSTTTLPETGSEAPCLTDCIPTADGIPTTADACIDCIPTAGGAFTPTVGSGSLPFTGIGDMIAPILLALTVVLGGVVAWRWAQLRESVAQAGSRARPLPAREARSGYAAALRAQDIERRARQVFTPRVA